MLSRETFPLICRNALFERARPRAGSVRLSIRAILAPIEFVLCLLSAPARAIRAWRKFEGTAAATWRAAVLRKKE